MTLRAPPENPQQRAAFEAWISASPFERSIAKFPTNPKYYPGPGTYHDLAVELAWEAWQAALQETP